MHHLKQGERHLRHNLNQAKTREVLAEQRHEVGDYQKQGNEHLAEINGMIQQSEGWLAGADPLKKAQYNGSLESLKTHRQAVEDNIKRLQADAKPIQDADKVPNEARHEARSAGKAAAAGAASDVTNFDSIMADARKNFAGMQTEFAPPARPRP